MRLRWLHWIKRPWVALVLVLLVHGPLVIRSGPLHAPDSRNYEALVDHVITHGFDFSGAPSWMERVFSRRPGFILIMLLCKIVGGRYWDELFLSLNLALDALVGALLTMLVLKITEARLAGWAALGAYLISFDIILWTRFVLSDTIFLFASFASFYAVATAVLEPPRQKLYWALAALAVAITLTIRPPGILLVPIALAGWFLSYHARKNYPNVAGLRRPWRIAVAGTAGVVVVWSALIGVMQRPSLWPFRLLSGALDVLATFFAQGVVIHDRPATYHPPPETFLDFMWIGVDRMIRFFQFSSVDFSAKHNLYGFAYFVPLYVLALTGLILFFRRKLALTQPFEVVVLLSALTILIFVLFHSITLVDFDWRYRLPLMPHLILLAVLPFRGVEQFISRRWSASKVLSLSQKAP